MKYFSVALIFWLSIWTAPKGVPWYGRALIVAWGFYLTRKMLNERNP